MYIHFCSYIYFITKNTKMNSSKEDQSKNQILNKKHTIQLLYVTTCCGKIKQKKTCLLMQHDDSHIFLEYAVRNVSPNRERLQTPWNRNRSAYNSRYCDASHDWLSKPLSGFCIRIFYRNESSLRPRGVCSPRDASDTIVVQTFCHKLRNDNPSDFHDYSRCVSSTRLL